MIYRFIKIGFGMKSAMKHENIEALPHFISFCMQKGIRNRKRLYENISVPYDLLVYVVCIA